MSSRVGNPRPARQALIDLQSAISEVDLNLAARQEALVNGYRDLER